MCTPCAPVKNSNTLRSDNGAGFGQIMDKREHPTSEGGGGAERRGRPRTRQTGPVCTQCILLLSVPSALATVLTPSYFLGVGWEGGGGVAPREGRGGSRRMHCVQAAPLRLVRGLPLRSAPPPPSEVGCSRLSIICPKAAPLSERRVLLFLTGAQGVHTYGSSSDPCST